MFRKLYRHRAILAKCWPENNHRQSFMIPAYTADQAWPEYDPQTNAHRGVRHAEIKTFVNKHLQRCEQKPRLLLGNNLDTFEKSDITPLLGTVLRGLQITDVLHSEACDAILRDLAVMISERGFVVLPMHSTLAIQEHKLLVRKLGQLTTRPATSDLWIHPVNHSKLPDGSLDGEYMTPSRDITKKLYIREGGYSEATAQKQSRIDGWHTDGTFENTPADYTALHMMMTPGCGGDTLFASAYEAYDLLSAPMQKFLEGLQATFQPGGHKPENIVDRLWPHPRGAPNNTGADLRATHPCIRTHPVTGWKSLYAFGHHLERIETLGDEENKVLCEMLQRLIVENHQIQARHRWSKDDLVVWDNRSVYHCATYDYGSSGRRTANRVCGCGETPFLDPHSTGRRAALQA